MTMQQTLVYAAIIILCSLLDRERGRYGGWIWIYAMVVSSAMGLDQYWSIYLIFAFVLGEAPGWGRPIGALLRGEWKQPDPPHWWQPSRRVVSSIFWRGILWGAPVSLASIPLAAMIALSFIIAAFATKIIPGGYARRWAAMEYIRGALIGASIVFITVYQLQLSQPVITR